MLISKAQTKSSSDIELPVLTSHALSFQPPPELVPRSSPILETNSENRIANSIAIVDGVEPPTPAYFPPLNDIPPIPSSDAAFLDYTRLHGHSEIPLSPRQREDDRTSVHASEAGHAEALPAYYRADNPPRYSHRRLDPKEPMTWPAVSFRIGFLFPLFWFFGALTLITPRGSLDRIFLPWFKDFAPSANSWRDTLQTDAEKEAYLARIRVAEIKWAKRCLFAFCLFLSFATVVAGTLVSVTSNH